GTILTAVSTSGSGFLMTWTPAGCSMSRSRKVWRSFRERPSRSSAITRTRCASRSAVRARSGSTRACDGCAGRSIGSHSKVAVVARRPLDASAVTEAAALIAPHIRRTPTERSEALSALSGCEIFLKLENLQKTGAFKIRGALHALLRKEAHDRVNGVVTASAGNHGQGVAYAAQLLGVPATVVLPQGVPLAKLTAIQRTGAEALLLGESYDEAHTAAVEIVAERTLAIVKRLVDDVITVSDEAIARAIVVLLERTKLLAEGAGAAALAAVLERDGRIGDGRKVGVVISGGNIDPNLLGKALQQG